MNIRVRITEFSIRTAINANLVNSLTNSSRTKTSSLNSVSSKSSINFEEDDSDDNNYVNNINNRFYIPSAQTVYSTNNHNNYKQMSNIKSNNAFARRFNKNFSSLSEKFNKRQMTILNYLFFLEVI
jgi:hypothetical protein